MTGRPARRGIGPLGVGIGWRPEIDLSIERLPAVDFVEVVAEDLDPRALPAALLALRERGVPVLAHAVGLSLGGAEPLDRTRVAHLAAVADALGSPLISDHVAFTRAGGLDTGHLLPVPRTRAALDVLVAHVREAQAELPAPLALENIAGLMSWPTNELTEAQFLTELLDRTGCLLLLDVANLYADGCNLGLDVAAFLAELPLERLAYVHVAGGLRADGLYHDTHAHPVPSPVFELLAALCTRVDPPGVLLERDDRYPADAALAAELDGIRSVMAGSARERSWRAPPPCRSGTPPVAPSSLPPSRLPDTATASPLAPPRPAREGSVMAGSARERSWRAPPPCRSGSPPVAPSSLPPSRLPDTATASPLAAARERLSATQGALVHALVAGGEPPAGFDPVRIARQAAALRSKRRRVIARLRPDVEIALGGDFAARFDAWAREHPPLVGSCAGADADAFAAWLVRAGDLAGPRPRRERLNRRRQPSRTSG